VAPLVLWARAAVAGSFLFLVAVWVARPWVGGDTPFVLDGTNALLECLSRRDFVGCRHHGELDFWGLTSPIGDWPLLQHIPDMISIGLGGTSHPDRTRMLALLSVAGVVGTVILGRVVLSRAGQAAWFWGFLLIVLSGPILAYARTTAGEMLAMGLVVALAAATLLRAPPALVALAALGACLTKETAYPFVAALGLLGLVLARRRTGLPIRRHVWWGAGGLAAGIVLASLLNIVRFGSVLNTNYLEPELHTPGIGRKLEYAIAVLVSPSGGVFVFWPAASVLLLAACLLPFVLRSSRRIDRRPALVLIAVSLGLTLGFASWWTPFGWVAYGPRFALPWIPAILLIGLVAYGEPLGALARRLLAPSWRLLLVFAGVFAFALPHVGHMWRPEPTLRFFGVTRPCDAPWRGSVEEWHSCQHELMWSRRPMPLYALQGVKTAGGAFTSVALAVGLLGCLILLREELGRRPSRSPG
jgi:hypothetical protein